MLSLSHRPSLSSSASFSSADLTDIPLTDLTHDTSRLIPQKPVRQHVRVQGKIALVRSISAATLRRPTSNPSSACPSPALPIPPPASLCRHTSVSPPGSVPATPKPAVSLRRQGSRRPHAYDHAVAGLALQKRSLDIPQTPDKSLVGVSVALAAEPEHQATHQALAPSQISEHTKPSMPGDMEEEERRALTMRDGQLRGYGIGGAGNIRRATDPYGASTTPKKRSLRDILGLGLWTDGRQINGGLHSPRH